MFNKQLQQFGGTENVETDFSFSQTFTRVSMTMLYLPELCLPENCFFFFWKLNDISFQTG
jgi:hypothetical protein